MIQTNFEDLQDMIQVNPLALMHKVDELEKRLESKDKFEKLLISSVKFLVGYLEDNFDVIEELVWLCEAGVIEPKDVSENVRADLEVNLT